MTRSRLGAAAWLFLCAAALASCTEGAGPEAPGSTAAAPSTTSTTSTTSSPPEATTETTDDPFYGYDGAELAYLKLHVEDIEEFEEQPQDVLDEGRLACAAMRAADSPPDLLADEDEPPPALDSYKAVSDRQAAGYMLNGDDPNRDAIKYLCPKLKPVLAWADAGFTDGPNKVGGKDGVKPGTYRTVDEGRQCYWERATKGGRTLANDFVKYAPSGVTVTIRSSDGAFTSDGCDAWLPVKRP